MNKLKSNFKKYYYYVGRKLYIPLYILLYGELILTPNGCPNVYLGILFFLGCTIQVINTIGVLAYDCPSKSH